MQIGECKLQSWKVTSRSAKWLYHWVVENNFQLGIGLVSETCKLYQSTVGLNHVHSDPRVQTVLFAWIGVHVELNFEPGWQWVHHISTSFGFEPEYFQLKYKTLQHSNKRFTLLTLIYIISSICKLKIKCFEYFLLIYQAAQNRRLKVVSWLNLCL